MRKLLVAVHQNQKKPTRWTTIHVVQRVGVLVNKPPGTAGVPFV
jgi:hypothetical protein